MYTTSIVMYNKLDSPLKKLSQMQRVTPLLHQGNSLNTELSHPIYSIWLEEQQAPLPSQANLYTQDSIPLDNN